MVSRGEHVAQGLCFTISVLCRFFHLLAVLSFIIQVIHASSHHYLSQFSVAGEEKQGSLCHKNTCLAD